MGKQSDLLAPLLFELLH